MTSEMQKLEKRVARGDLLDNADDDRPKLSSDSDIETIRVKDFPEYKKKLQNNIKKQRQEMISKY